jgi:FkbM family methyltransferase
LGAHKGEFSSFISEKYRCRIFGIEANPIIHATIPQLPNSLFLNCAISGTDADFTFYLSENVEASSIIKNMAESCGCKNELKVRGYSLESLMRNNNIKKLSLLKVDVEGAEYELFDSTPDNVWINIDQITTEFHLPCTSLQIYQKKIKQIASRFENLGYKSYIFDKNFGDVLFIKKDFLKYKTFQQRIAFYFLNIISKIRMFLLSK